MTASTENGSDDDHLESRVAMLLQGSEVYGIGTILKLYAAALPELSFVSFGNGPMVDWLKARGNRIDIVPGLTEFRSGGLSLGVLLRSTDMLRQARRDAARIDGLLRPRGIRILHAHHRSQQITAGFLRGRGYRSVWQINNTMNRGRLLGLGVKLNHRVAAWGADLLLPASDAIGASWKGCGVPSTTILNAALPLYDRANVLPETPIRCIVAGRLEHCKGHHLAAEAVIRARRAGHDVRLDVFGGPLEDNPYAEELRRRIAAADCAKAIRLMGFQTDVRSRHQQYHLALQCRIDVEPCSLWVCETMVDGVPVVGSATGGTPELVADGETGLLFPSDDVTSLTERLIALASAPERLRAMRFAAFERGRKMFTVDRFARETLSAYRRLLAPANAPAGDNCAATH